MACVIAAGCTGEQAPQVQPSPSPTATALPQTPPVPVSGGNAPSTNAITVVMKNFAFYPASLNVPKGSVVKFINRDPIHHTIVNDASDRYGEGAFFTFDAPTDGLVFTVKFDNTGVYPYHCVIYPGMKGTITVTEG